MKLANLEQLRNKNEDEWMLYVNKMLSSASFNLNQLKKSNGNKSKIRPLQYQRV